MAVVLTATIRPPAESGLAVRDEDVRRRQYQASLSEWMDIAARMGNCDLVFAENSGADLTGLAPRSIISAARFAAMNVPPPDGDSIRRGKGACEALMLDAAMAEVTAESASYAMIYKCTGRLTIPNFARCTDGDHPGIQASLRSDLQWLDSRCWGAPPTIWRSRYRGMGEEVDEATEGGWLEHVVRRRTLQAVADGARFSGWAALPRFRGQSGSTGVRYDSPRNRVLRSAHATQRWLARARPFTL